MCALCIGDIHGNITRTKRFLEYKPEIQHIFVGDYVDDFVKTEDEQIQVVETVLASDSILVIGNHDLNYITPAPFYSSGYQQDSERLHRIINDNKRRFVASHIVDGYLITHAGCHIDICPVNADSVEDLRDYLNGCMDLWLDKFVKTNIFNISRSRGGHDRVGGIFWYDYRSDVDFQDGDTLAPFPQIFGHSESGRIVIGNNEGIPWVCVDCRGSQNPNQCFNTENGKIETFYYGSV